MAENFLLKNIVNDKMVDAVAYRVGNSYAAFDREGFVGAVMAELEPLSLTERAWLVTDKLGEFLPDDYPKALKILMDSTQVEIDMAELGKYSEFFYMPYGNFVSKFGLDHFDISMEALNLITRRFTSEFPIRAFIQKYPERTMAMLHQWALDENHHVRRLVSEGTRPRLPWAPRLREFQKDPTPVLELLELLKEDPELYVRRSVANNLNDIAKDNPDLVVDVLKKWARIENDGTQWIIKHAARSLVKAGHPEALSLLGYNPNVKIRVTEFRVDAEIPMDGIVHFTFEIESEESKPVDLMIDYVLHFMKANGKLAPKVFKLAKKSLKPGEKQSLKGKQSFKPISTRKYYPGMHAVELQINGKFFGRKEFEVI